MSSSILLITYRGRKSGKEFNLPVQYAQDGHFIYIVPGMPEQKSWWRNFHESTPVQLTLRGEELSGIGVLLDPATQENEIIIGIETYLRRFPSLAGSYDIRAKPGGGWENTDLHRAVEKVLMIRVELNKPERT
jgi:hypothetical protein